jgi:hypothetical protein
VPIAKARRLRRIWKVARRHPLWRGDILQNKSHLSRELWAQVRGFEPLTRCVSSTISAFPEARSCRNLLAIAAILFVEVS